MTRHAGFTLVEIMIMVVIGIILASAAIPTSVSLSDQRVAADARVLGGDIEFARARAIATSQQHRILFDLANERYSVESPPGTVLEEPLSRKPWVRVLRTNPQAFTDLLDANFGGATALSIDAAGRPSAGGVVTLRRDSFIATITVTAITGAVDLTLP
jgi:type II secretory pathway pseudopilin PulG